MKNFSKRINALKSAVFGVKEIVEDSILSDFKDPNPQTVVDVESTEATKEIEKTKESIEVVDKTEGTDGLKNFSIDYKSLAEKISDFIEEQGWGPGNTPSDISELSNDLWERAEFKPSPGRSNLPELDINKIKNIIEKYNIDLDGIQMNFADKNKDKITNLNDNKYYEVFKKYLKAARTQKHFENLRNASSDPGFCNRYIKDTKFIRDFEGGLDLGDIKDKSSVISLRKGFTKYIKEAKKASDKAAEESSKKYAESYIADADNIKDKDLKTLVISMKRSLIGSDSGALNETKLILDKIPGLGKIIKSDKKLDELITKSKNFAESVSDYWNKLSDKEVSEDDIKKSLDESDSELKDTISHLIQSIDKGGMYLSPDDAKKENEKLSKDALKIKDTIDLANPIKVYIQRKLAKKDKKSEDEEILAKEAKLFDLKKGKARIDARFKLAEALTSGMEEPAKSFVEGIIGFFKTKSDIKHGEALEPLLSESKKASKDLPKELEIKDDDIELDDSSENKDSKSDPESAKPKEVSKSEEKKDEAKKVAFSSDPMEALFEGHLNKEYTEIKNFSVSKEFEDYEKVLNSISEI